MATRLGRSHARPDPRREPRSEGSPAPATPEPRQQPPLSPADFPYRVRRDLAVTSPPLTGPDVRAVQHALQVRRLYQGPINGVYDAATARAVTALQSLTGALSDGRVTADIYRALVVSCIFNAEWAVPPEFPRLPESPQLLPEVVYEQGLLTCRLGPLYRAGAGETLFTIADRFGYLPQDVVAVNPHIPNPDRIPEGEVVALPFPSQRRR